ncbi:type II secretion system F family protein [Acidithiobacillus sp. AMEEHan]|uniref:type II secretion system F family protein n=1 Tax=Acidithiobacillus sp. AMEEHan TaxID=2994951 RepID=UPI0027E4C702|nr:type II secretion system F family protein [Acidithiobacillus sp. AMEEHan]
MSDRLLRSMSARRLWQRSLPWLGAGLLLLLGMYFFGARAWDLLLNNTGDLPVLLVGALAGAVAVATLFGLSLLFSAVEKQARDYMDPLPKGLAHVWPLVRFINSTIVVFLPNKLVYSSAQRLQKAGLHYLVTPRDFFSLKILAALFPAFFSLLVYVALGIFRWEITLLAMLLMSFYPDLWLVEQAKKRQKRILKDLPVYLDFITLMVEGGLNLTGAIQIAVDKGPEGPLRNEFRIILRDLRSGMPRIEVFRRFGERVAMQELRSLVTAIIQSEERGGSLAPVLKAQAEQRREERFLRAEKAALEAPVKLLAPLVMFIFPIVFLVLAFVIYMKYVQEVAT